jgi:hypothetical protein
MIENLSAIQHEIWVEWMSHLFQVSTHNKDGTVTISADKVSRWKKQIKTAYDDLSESEKDSDRKQARKISNLLPRFNTGENNMVTSVSSQRPSGDLDYGLFSKPTENMTEHEVNILLEQYKLFVDMSDKVSERRHQANTFFLSVNTVLITALTGFISLPQLTTNHHGWILIASLAGIIFCLTWRQLIVSYSQLNKGKFKIIHLLESYLPARLFYAEWNAVNKGDGTVYTPFTKVEVHVPIAFICLYLVLFVFLIISIF